MSLTYLSRLILMAVLAMTVSGLVGPKAYGQDSGRKPYIVTKGKVFDIEGRDEKIIADFDTLEEACKDAQDWSSPRKVDTELRCS